MAEPAEPVALAALDAKGARKAPQARPALLDRAAQLALGEAAEVLVLLGLLEHLPMEALELRMFRLMRASFIKKVVRMSSACAQTSYNIKKNQRLKGEQQCSPFFFTKSINKLALS